ncbi:hypothetical protein M3J09_009674 [Ascochyta lentis]
MADTMSQLDLHEAAVAKRRLMERQQADEKEEQRRGEALRRAHVKPRVRAYVNPRSYPVLPRQYRWKEQKEKYCPPDFLKRPLDHKFGYVFCHRGLYDRARDIVDNSEAAITNGVKQKMYLHEIDSFVLGRVDHAIVAHDKVSGRVTAENKAWSAITFATTLKTFLVSKAVNLKRKEFAKEYRNTDDRVPGLLGAIWKELLEPTGVTLHIDFRDQDFAKIFPFYSYHITKGGYQPDSLSHRLFKSTMFKGYNIFYSSFSKLEEEIKTNCESLYGQNYFKREHLHRFPRLIMVFSAEPLDNLAKSTWDSTKGSDPNPSFRHLYKTIYEQVESFVAIGPARYNFILEIGHSGLGLGYDLQKRKASNPLNGVQIKCEKVKYQSRLDRAMIDVSLRIREKYPKVLFSSCTRLPDVVSPNGANYKVRFATAKLQKWDPGEEGIANELRAIHGGLYPQSNMVIADNPLAEIAARTWIDQEAGLDRSELLNIPYDKWLEKGGRDLVKAMGLINGIFMANRVGDLTAQSDRTKPHDATIVSRGNFDIWSDAEAFIENNPKFLDAEQEEEYYDDNERSLANPVSGLKDTRLFSPEQNTTINKFSALVAVTDPSGYTRFYEGGPSDRRRIINIGEEVFVFDNVDNAIRASNSLRIYQMASKGRLDVDGLRRMLQHGADINALTGLYGTPLAAACGGPRPDWVTARLLIEKGDAEVCVRGPFGFPLEIAAAKGDQKIVKMLLEHTRLRKISHDHKPVSESLHAGLHAACRHGFVFIVYMILDEYKAITGTEMVVDYVDQRYGSALQVACLRGHVEVVKLLLDKHADMYKETGLFGTPLSAACVQGHQKIVQELIDRGFKFATQTRSTSPLYWACMYGHENIANILMSQEEININALGDVQGATSNELKHRGRELLNQMLTTHIRPVIDGRLRASVGRHVLRKETRSALSAATARGYQRIVDALLKRGADVDLRVGDGGSALYWACVNGHTAIARLLLKHKARVDNHDTPASSALYGAYVGGHLEIFILLLENNTRFDLPTGTTPSRKIEDWLDTPKGQLYEVQRVWSGSKIIPHAAELGFMQPQAPQSPDPLLLDDGHEAWKMAGSSLGSRFRDCGGPCPICTLDQYMADIRSKASKPFSRSDLSSPGYGGDDPGNSHRTKSQAPPPQSRFDQPPPSQYNGGSGATRDIDLTESSRGAQSRHYTEGLRAHHEHAERDSRRQGKHPRSFPLVLGQEIVPPADIRQQRSQDVRTTHGHLDVEPRTAQTAITGHSRQREQYQHQRNGDSEGRYRNTEQRRRNHVERPDRHSQLEPSAHPQQHQARQEPMIDQQQVHLSVKTQSQTRQGFGLAQGGSINNLHQHRVSPLTQGHQQASMNTTSRHHQYTSSPQMTYDHEESLQGHGHEAPVRNPGENHNRSRAGYVAAGAAGGATAGVAATTFVTEDASQKDNSRCCCWF